MGKQKRAEITRQQIIEAGIRLFSTAGYHSTSSKKIAREAGVAVGSFYNHFRDKKHLLQEIQQLHSQKVHRLIRQSLQEADHQHLAQDGRSLVQQMIQHTLHLHTYPPDLHREITSLEYSDADFAALGQQEEKQAIQHTITYLKQHQDKLRVQDLEAAAIVISQAIKQVVHSIKIFGAPIAQQRITEALGEMIYRFLYKDS